MGTEQLNVEIIEKEIIKVELAEKELITIDLHVIDILTGAVDEKVKADASDPISGYLDAKVDDVNLAINLSTHKLVVKSGSELADAITKKHDSHLLGTKILDESAIEDLKILQYKASSGKIEYISLPGGGDMLKSVYDIGDNGIVDKAEKLNDGSSGGANNVTELEGIW